MDPVTAAALIGAGANLIGGSMAQSSADANRAVQMQMAQNNINLQRDFAEHGVSWKAADAVQAERDYGINKLVGMGASTTSFSPVSVGDLGGSPMGSAVSAAGQNLGRAAQAMLSGPSRAELLNEKLIEAKIANVNADTVRMTAAASEIATRTAPGSVNGPISVPLPSPDPRTADTLPGTQDYRFGKTRMTLPSQEVSNATQTLAAAGINVPLAGYFAGANLGNASRAIADADLGSYRFPTRGELARYYYAGYGY